MFADYLAQNKELSCGQSDATAYRLHMAENIMDPIENKNVIIGK